MINGLEINWKEMIDQTLSFLGNGLGNVLGSTFNMVNIVVNSVSIQFFQSFCDLRLLR